jgi:hypothetical protein
MTQLVSVMERYLSRGPKLALELQLLELLLTQFLSTFTLKFALLFRAYSRGFVDLTLSPQTHTSYSL